MTSPLRRLPGVLPFALLAACSTRPAPAPSPEPNSVSAVADEYYRDFVEARPLAVGAGLSISGDARVNDARIDRTQILVADLEPRLHVGSEILDHHVGLLRQPKECLAPLLRLQVERDAALVAMQVLEIARMARAADRIARLEPFRRFDLDHVGAPVRELAHAGRARAYAREIGLRIAPLDPGDRGSIAAMRATVLDVLREASDGSPPAGRKWTARYAAHRIAWHALDHAWEIEDKSEPTG